jgi:hypothetical protein
MERVLIVLAVLAASRGNAQEASPNGSDTSVAYAQKQYTAKKTNCTDCSDARNCQTVTK